MEKIAARRLPLNYCKYGGSGLIKNSLRTQTTTSALFAGLTFESSLYGTCARWNSRTMDMSENQRTPLASKAVTWCVNCTIAVLSILSFVSFCDPWMVIDDPIFTPYAIEYNEVTS